MTLEYIVKRCTGKTLDDLLGSGAIDWLPGYANGNDCKPNGLLIANWNDLPHGGREWIQGQGYPDTKRYDGVRLKHNGTTFEASKRFQDILEKLGYTLEWSDEISRCDDCGKGVRTSPDWFEWTPEFHVFSSGELVCAECIRKNPDDYINELEETGVTPETHIIDGISLSMTLIQQRVECGATI